MKTPAKKATKAAAKAPAKGVSQSRKPTPKPSVKAKPATPKAKAAPAKTKVAPVKAKAAPVKAKSASKAKAAPAKAPVKAVTKAKAAPPKAKAVAKTRAPAPAKAPAKKSTVAKSAPKKALPVAKKAAVKPVPVPKTRPAPRQSAPTPAKVPASRPAKATAAAPAPAASVATPDLPIRSSRPSARLAQITVPSMPQAVASTAAKASFLPSMPTTVLPAATAPAKKDPKLANNWKNKPVEQLTDAEVLAMSDAEYMNDAQMAFFRLKLVQLKQDILNNAGETTEHLREDTVVVPDPADRATIEEEHALELRTRDRERKLLKKIEQSIARIDAGDYGYCDETGEPIGVGRLLARPTATLSLEAQQRRELKQKMFGD